MNKRKFSIIVISLASAGLGLLALLLATPVAADGGDDAVLLIPYADTCPAPGEYSAYTGEIAPIVNGCYEVYAEQIGAGGGGGNNLWKLCAYNTHTNRITKTITLQYSNASGCSNCFISWVYNTEYTGERTITQSYNVGMGTYGAQFYFNVGSGGFCKETLRICGPGVVIPPSSLDYCPDGVELLTSPVTLTLSSSWQGDNTTTDYD